METTDVNKALLTEEESANLNCNEISGSGSDKTRSKTIFKTRTCSYFYNYGYCKFGNSCKYNHFRGILNGKCGYKNKKSPAPQSVRTHKQVDTENTLKKQQYLEQNCRYFDMGGCKKGENCEFLHSVDRITDEMGSLSVSHQSQNIPKKISSSSNRSSKRKTPLCYYYKKGLCYNGDNCKYYHQNKNNLSSCEISKNSGTKNIVDNDNSSTKSVDNSGAKNIVENSAAKSIVDNANVIHIPENPATMKTITVFTRNSNVYNLDSLTTDIAAQLRSTEINQLKKRFPHFEVVIEDHAFSILFEPSDPDWAFDVNKLKLEVDFPVDYPIEKCKITVLQNIENMPHLLIKHLNTAICDWIDKNYEENRTFNKVDLIFRPFLRWFDKNLEDLFITGLRKVKQDLKAKEDGIEFVPVENLFSSPQKNNAENETASENSAENDFQEDVYLANSSHLPEQNVLSNSKVSSQMNQQSKPSYYSSNDGMKVIFTDLEFVEGVATFSCTKISATLQCSRCKTSFNMKTVSKKSNSQICVKCSKTVGFMFEPAILHQFSSVLGILHLLDCVAVDINLVECHFLVDCLNCSKHVPVDGIHYGQKHKMWCTFCSEKMLLSVGSVKFQTVKLTSATAVKYPSAKKTEKKSKDPVVKEGEPLPNFGACKHYKKSFRWLRFPCCGRIYPCDECHDEKETDHEMKYASRMLCGFCGKEQPYSREKPCILCSQSMTKKSGSHWEGGKGCRNKIQMCREDRQKYSGVSKTVSRRAQMNKPKKKH